MSSESENQSSGCSGCLGLLVILFVVGALVGRMMSPDWSDRVTVLQSMSANMRVEQTRFGDALAVDCGTDTYLYHPVKGMARTVAPPEAWSDKSIRRRGGIDETEKLAGLLFGGAIIEQGVIRSGPQHTQGQKRTSKAAGLIAMVAVVGLGFYIGYDGEPDCEEAKPVYQDVAVWRMFAQQQSPPEYWQRRSSTSRARR
jgi:hypothetical protein